MFLEDIKHYMLNPAPPLPLTPTPKKTILICSVHVVAEVKILYLNM